MKQKQSKLCLHLEFKRVANKPRLWNQITLCIEIAGLNGNVGIEIRMIGRNFKVLNRKDL